MSLEMTANLVPTTDAVPTTPIGLGKPLSMRILSMYPGAARHDGLLVTSAVKSGATYDARPRAMHYVFDKVGGRVVRPLPSQSGSRIIYYSPAVLDSRLDVEVRFAYDDFDYDGAKHWLEVASAAANLPVFAVATALGGPGGAAAGKSILYFAEQAVKVVLGAIDRLVDSDNDWVSTGTFSFNVGNEGIKQSSPGYVLFFGDDEDAQVLSPVGGDLTQQDFMPRSTAYQVNPDNGTVVYADSPDEVVEGDEPYVLTYVNGADEDELQGWKAAAVSAALASKFLNVHGDTASDLGELLAGYNDMVMATKYATAAEQLKKPNLTAEQKSKLEREKDAYLKYIQDEKVKELVTKADEAK